MRVRCCARPWGAGAGRPGSCTACFAWRVPWPTWGAATPSIAGILPKLPAIASLGARAAAPRLRAFGQALARDAYRLLQARRRLLAVAGHGGHAQGGYQRWHAAGQDARG